MRSETRREQGRIYGEMYESGYNPSRGLGPLMTAAALCTLLGLIGFVVLPLIGWNIFHTVFVDSWHRLTINF